MYMYFPKQNKKDIVLAKTFSIYMYLINSIDLHT